MKRIFIVPVLLLTTWTFLTGNAIDSKSQWQNFLSREGKDWRATFQDSGRIRAIYGRSVRPFVTPEAFIHDYETLLGLTRSDELRLIRKEIFDSGFEYVYQQHLSEIPIAGAEVHFNF